MNTSSSVASAECNVLTRPLLKSCCNSFPASSPSTTPGRYFAGLDLVDVIRIAGNYVADLGDALPQKSKVILGSGEYRER